MTRTKKLIDPVAAAMREKDLEQHVRKIWLMLQRNGKEVIGYHTYRSDRSEPGFPDWVFVGPAAIMYRELKKENGRVTPAQKQWLESLQRAGADADVWRPTDLLSGRIARELTELAG